MTLRVYSLLKGYWAPFGDLAPGFRPFIPKALLIREPELHNFHKSSIYGPDTYPKP